jgi:hypothetical protein
MQMIRSKANFRKVSPGGSPQPRDYPQRLQYRPLHAFEAD